jgi:hypothetical protein
VLEGREGRRTTRLVGESRTSDPEQRHGRDRVEVEVFDRQVHVGGLWLAVEQNREVVGRVDLTECQGGPQLWVSRHPTGIHPELFERRADVLAEAVVASLGYEGGGVAETGGGDGHVRRAAAEGLGEGLDLGERDPDLLGVQVHAHPSHRNHFRFHR